MNSIEKMPRLHFRSKLALKRCFDFVFAVIALALLSPVMLAAVVVVKSGGKGPVFYRGVRAGLNGRPFRIFKFRTMVDGAEKMGGPTTCTSDPRVTPSGWFMRRTKMDELPQLFNVIAGDMSIVGPRPEVMEYASRYQGDEKLILTMRPGITDYASIAFADLDDRVGSEDADAYFRQNILPEKNSLRVRYVREWSLAGDMRILFATVWRVFKRVVYK